MTNVSTSALSHMKRFLVSVVAAMCALSATVLAGNAQAATYHVVGTGGTLHIRTAPSLGASTVASLRDGTSIDIVCQTRGDAVVGSTMWDKIDQPVAGYVADWYTTTPAVNNPSPGLPGCGSQAPTAPPPPPSPQSKELRNRASVRCLDADRATLGANGTKVMLWDCWGGSNQNWSIASDGTIHNQASGRCLDADAGTINHNGTLVQLRDCNGRPNQRWTIDANGTIRNQASGRTLDANGGTINTNGTKVQLWDYNHGRNQAWYNASALSLPKYSTKHYCPSLFSDSGISFAPCITVSDVSDGTSAAPRSIRLSSCDFQNGWFETLTCTSTHTGSYWTGAANADYATISATLTESSVVYAGGWNGYTTYLYYTWTIDVDTASSGVQTSHADEVGLPGGSWSGMNW